MIYTIPWDDSPDFSQTLELSGEIFRLRARWNDVGFWAFDLYDKDDTPLLLGQKIVANVDFLARYRDPRLPAGSLFLLELTPSPVGRGDIGTNAVMVYAV